MSALANEEGLKKIDGNGVADHRRTSRPFGDNCGFTIGEAAQFIILMDDALAIELGANVLGSVADVYTNADGIKKSITAPGPGNYITMAKSVSLAKSIVGAESVQQRSFILAHGSSTPQNRVTESLIYDRVAKSFDINNWPVAAPKAFVGHTIGPASGDQVAMALGVFAHNIMPGITTIDKVADDVYNERLNIATQHWECQDMDVAFINSKGFGGNNATATLFSPAVTLSMIEKRHGSDAIQSYREKSVAVEQARVKYQTQADSGDFQIIYRFGDGTLTDDDVSLTDEDISVTGFANKIVLPTKNPFGDMV
jgi:acetoacetyl-[acyl-carrier protein] synthase